MASNESSEHAFSSHNMQLAEEVRIACDSVTRMRQKPLLLLYYPGLDGAMTLQDVQDCYRAFRNANLTIENPIPECDVLIHTYGGDPIAAYKLAQIINDFVRKIIYLVPEYAYSAGTLLCLSGKQIRLGHYAGLSPIDIFQEEIELASIDNFIKFTKDCQKGIQDILSDKEKAHLCTVASDLLCHLVEQVGALKVGEYYRARTLTGYYAEELLDHYMLVGLSNAKGKRNRIIRWLLFEAPSHSLHMDFHMCNNIGLVIEEMTTQESDATKHVVSLLDELTEQSVICQNITDDLKMPFIAFYQ